MYDPRMGQDDRDQQLRKARARYRAAVRQLDRALRRFDDCDIPLEPGPAPEPAPWTVEHIEIVVDVPNGFRALAHTRRVWDGLRSS